MTASPRRTRPAPSGARVAPAVGRDATRVVPDRHHLQPMLTPASVVVIGASERPDSAPGAVLRKLLAAGFRGRIDLVNPKHSQVHGLPCVPRIADLPEAADLAIVGIRATATTVALDQLVALGTGYAVLIGHGPGRDALRRQARSRGIRLLGPESLGIAHPASGFDATLSRSKLSAGGLAIVSESAAVLAALLDTAEGTGIGLSQVASTGSAADIDTAELLDFLGHDYRTRAIAAYVEGVGDARRLLGSLRAAARAKPVVILHAGQHGPQSPDGCPAGSTRTHTEILASSDDIFEAAMRRCGAVCVRSYGELLGALEWLAAGNRVHGNRLAVVSNGGGLGTLAIDACHRMGVQPTGIDGAVQRLPLDVGIGASPAAIADAVAEAGQSAGPDAVLGVFQQTQAADCVAIAQALVQRPTGPRPTLFTFVGEANARLGADQLNAAGHSVFRTPESAVRSFELLVQHHRGQQQNLQAPSPGHELRRFDGEAIRQGITEALARGQTVLDEVSSKRLLAACGITIPQTLVATDEDEALALAEVIGYPVVLKVLSPDVSRKSDVGGVVLDLPDATALRAAVRGIRERLKAAAPKARLTGFSVQPMIRRGHAIELLVGSSRDPAFGPTIHFGAGGIATEITADVASALPPLNDLLARDLIARTRVARLLAGYRNVPAANESAIIDTLLALSALVCRFPAIRALDINPLIANANGVLALDACIVLDPAAPLLDSRHSHLAIAPYPEDEERLHPLRTIEGEARPPFVLVRPIRPDDAGLLVRFFEALSDESRQFRFLHPIKRLSPEMIARFTQVDYDRDMAFVAELQPNVDSPGGLDATSGPIIGVARYVREANAQRCEFATVTADAWQRRGLARVLMTMLIDHARSADLALMVGYIHGQNRPMLRFMQQLGFALGDDPDDPGLKRASLDLRTMAVPAAPPRRTSIPRSSP